LPPRLELREEDGTARRPDVEAEEEALEGYQRWEFHPTKQFVRRYGWLEPVQAFLEARADTGLATTWKYLTLPGKDALDVGLFYREGLLDRHDDGWRTLAICDRDFGTQVVKKIGRPMLGWASENIEEILFSPNHPVTTSFPYEVINLDYCGPLFLELQRWRLHGRPATVGRICVLQRRCAFLLLLTTQDSSHKIRSEARERMAEYLRWNIDHDSQFRSQYEAMFKSLDAEACLADFESFAQIVVPKVVALYASNCGYEVKELFAASYLREDQQGEGYRMICHTFELNPVGRSGVERFQPDPKISELLVHPSLSDVLSCLSREERDFADEARSKFVTGLLTRNPVDVSAKLEEDEDLANMLAADIEDLRHWWEAL